MPALPLDDAGPYVAAAYLVFLALILIYVAIMASKLVRIERELVELADLVEGRRAAAAAEADREAEAQRGGAAMSELMALGASHKTAGVAVRERIALTDAAAERFMRELVSEEEIQEAVVLSTCNRTELYLVVGDAVEAETAVLGRLARRAGVRPTELLEGIYSLRNCDAARHLYRVTSGLESMVVGEAEVQGQVKRAYEAALATQSTGPLTNKLFRAALATGKRVRTDTAISVGHASVASVAVDAAREALGDLGSRHVLIIGAGETAEGTARALHEQGVRTMFVANRRRERAIELAQRFGGETVAFDALPDELARADIVVASTSSPHLILGAEELALVMPERAGRPLLLIDLAVPRDIDPACAELPGVTLSDIDDLQRQVDAPAARPPHRGPQGRGHRRGGDPDVRRLARLARGDADAGRAAHAAATRSSTGC